MILGGLELLHPRADALGDRKRDVQVRVRLEIGGRQPALHGLGLSLDLLNDGSRVVA